MQKKTTFSLFAFAVLLLVLAAAGTASAAVPDVTLEIDLPDTAYPGDTVTGYVWIKNIGDADKNITGYMVNLTANPVLHPYIDYSSEFLNLGAFPQVNDPMFIAEASDGTTADTGYYAINPSSQKLCTIKITIPSDAPAGTLYSVNITKKTADTPQLKTTHTLYYNGVSACGSIFYGTLSAGTLTTVNDTITVAASTPYNISYIQPSAGGTISGPASKNSGSTVTVTAAPSSGYQFDKLIVTRNGTGASVTSSGNTFTMPAFDVNVTAQFKLNPTPVPTQSPTRPSGGGDSQENSASTWLTGKMYSVSFIMNGHGTQVMNQSLSYGSVVAEPYPAPTADGYTFNGWYSDKYLTSKYIFSTPVTYDINLYAGWTQTYIPAIPIKTPVPQASTPAPFLGILAGLGAAVFFGMRRT